MRIPVVIPLHQAAAGVAMALAASILLGAGPPAPLATPGAVDLGTAAAYVVLAGGGVSDTGPSVIAGDVGTHPGLAIPDLLDREATGRVDRAGARPQLAQQDLAGAFASVGALPSDGTVSLADDRTLAPGVYAVADTKEGFAGNLTLDGEGATNPVWIFVVATDLVTAPASTLTLVNGAQACNVFWHVGGSATLAAGSTFAGSILASESVTVGQGVTVAGRLLARTGAVALAGVTITSPSCAPGAAGPVAHAAAAEVPPASLSATGPVVVHRSPLPASLPIAILVLLVMAVVFGEPHHGRSRSRRA